MEEYINAWICERYRCLPCCQPAAALACWRRAHRWRQTAPPHHTRVADAAGIRCGISVRGNAAGAARCARAARAPSYHRLAPPAHRRLPSFRRRQANACVRKRKEEERRKACSSSSISIPYTERKRRRRRRHQHVFMRITTSLPSIVYI